MTIQEVPFFPYPKVYLEHARQMTQILDNVGRRGAFIMQRDLVEFEERVSRMTGAHAVGLGNATDALEMLLSVAGVGPGDDVLFSSHTMVATASAIHCVGANPIPVNCDGMGRIDVQDCRRRITPATKAIVPTQLNGTTCDMDALGALCDEQGLLLIEDSAQGLGATYRGQHPGTFGFGGCISFYPAKNLGTFGDGGVALVTSEQARDHLRMLRDHGRDPASGEVRMWGRNSRLDNLHAAFLNHLLDHYQETVRRRRAIAQVYHGSLFDVAEVRLPAAPDSEPNRFDVFQNYEIAVEPRDELKAYLAEGGVGSIIQWGGKAVHEFAALGLPSDGLEQTERHMRQILLLPMNQFLSEDEAFFVASRVRHFFS